MTTSAHLKTMFGIKIARLREARGLRLSGLAAQAGMSVSYLAEIEAGKKFPRADKLLALAAALGTTFDELVSSRVDAELAPLVGYLESPGVREFPFERFGLPREDLVHLLSRSPTEATALLRTLSEIAHQYNIGVEHLLRASLRSYQELTGNYYPELETAAEAFAKELGVGIPGGDLEGVLRRWVREELGVQIDDNVLGREGPLVRLRSVLLPGNPPRLLLNPRLTPSQTAFILAREAGYRRLGLSPRSLASPPDREESFDQVLNDFRTSYFAGALLLPRRSLLADLRKRFREAHWRARSLLELLDQYDVTAETLMYRLSQLAPGEFGLKVHFLKFIDQDGDYQLVKQLNLSSLKVPPGYGGSEHYCRRWLTTRLLTELAGSPAKAGRRVETPRIGVQLSRFMEGGDEYFCLGLAQPAALSPGRNMSLTIGFRVDDAFRRTVRFAADPAIPRALISSTCERCPLEPRACRERVAEPTLHRAEEARAAEHHALLALQAATPG